jgi:mRNA interferase MazF
MVMNRGEIWWADLPNSRQSEPGYRRPVLIVQADSFNRSKIRTVLVLAISSNLRLAEAPGNVFLPSKASVLPKDSVANVSQVVTLDKDYLREYVGTIPPRYIKRINQGLRLVLHLEHVQ